MQSFYNQRVIIEVHGLKTGKQMRAGLGEILTVVLGSPVLWLILRGNRMMELLRKL